MPTATITPTSIRAVRFDGVYATEYSSGEGQAGIDIGYATTWRSAWLFELPADFSTTSLLAELTFNGRVIRFDSYGDDIAAYLGYIDNATAFASQNLNAVLPHFAFELPQSSGYPDLGPHTDVPDGAATSITVDLTNVINSASSRGRLAGGFLQLMLEPVNIENAYYNQASIGMESLSLYLSYAAAGPSLSLSVAPSTFADDETATGTVTRSGYDVSAATVVDLSSSATGVATVPSTVTIPIDETSADFTVTGVAPGTATITASHDDADDATDDITVIDADTSTLILDLVEYWPLDEASGNAIGSLGVHNLTASNGPTSVAGKINTARRLTKSSSQLFSKAGALALGNTDFTFAAWVRFASLSQYPCILGRWDYSGGKREYTLEYPVAVNRFRWHVSSNGTSDTYVDANNFGTASTNVWYLVHVWHDSVNNLIGVSVNAGTPNTASHSAGVHTSDTTFYLGRLSTNDANSLLDGTLDEVAVWSRVLSSDERVEHYNSGNGLPYPFILSPVAYAPGPLVNRGLLNRGLRR